MILREVVLHDDVRAPFVLSRLALLNRYKVRRTASVLALLAIDVGSVLFGLAIVQWSWAAAIEVGVAGAVALLTAAALGLYRLRRQRHSLVRILVAALAGLVAGLIASALLSEGLTGAGFVLVWGIAVSLDTGLRALYDFASDRVLAPHGDLPTALLVGRADDLVACAELLRTRVERPQYRVVGVVSDGPLDDGWQSATGLTQVGLVDELRRVVDAQKPAAIVVSNGEATRAAMPELVETCGTRCITLELAATTFEFGEAPVSFIPGFEVPLFVRSNSLPKRLSFILKRVLDVVIAFAALIVLSPLFLAIAVLVKATSPGPVFYTDTRIGLGQRPFRCFKFRTMVRDAAARQQELEALNEAGNVLFKLRDDPRVTTVGRWLRRTSLDELPQLINVVEGEMSLVGPRPLPVRDVALMEERHKRRHLVLPGITGLWQVSGRSELGFDAMLELDDEYVRTWSLASDARIVWRTVAAVFGSKGAY